jgi:type II secretory ATPase GspE/PulE/Tfp pilus assembly ATPase PilB-like protein
MFEMSEYRGWIERRSITENKGLLWIKGKPGSGKSVMIKNMLMHVQTHQPSSCIISFFFNARGGPLEKRPLGLYQSL